MLSLRGQILISLVLCCIQFDTAFTQISSISPQAQTGYSGSRLTYSCIASRGVKYWLIDRFNAESDERGREPFYARVTRSRDGQTTWLSVDASHATNNSIVTCWLYNPPNDERTTATILVQGALDPPTDVFATYDTSSITLYWVPPYTLPGTEIKFRITVSIPGHSNSIMTTQNRHTFSYSALNIRRCHSDHTINFTVHGVNPAGDGKPSSISVLVPQNTSLCGEFELSTGKLDPPTDLTTNTMKDFVTLTWTPPFTLCDISHYTIKTTGPIARTQTNGSSYSFAFVDLGIVNPCSNSYQFTLSVCGVNYAGEGDFSSTTVTIHQDPRYCPTSPAQSSSYKESTTRQMETTGTINATLSEDMSLYIGVGALVLVLTLTVFAITGFAVCCLLSRRKRPIKTEPQNYIMDRNNCFATTQLEKNSAYVEPPHHYEVIAPQVYGQHVDA